MISQDVTFFKKKFHQFDEQSKSDSAMRILSLQMMKTKSKDWQCQMAR